MVEENLIVTDAVFVEGSNGKVSVAGTYMR